MTSGERPVPSPRERPPALPRKKKPQAPSSEFHVICLSPSSVIYNKHESVVVVFNQSLPSNVEFTIKFTGIQTKKETQCDAQKIGDNVLTFRAPEHYPPEDVELSVHHGSQLTKLCTCPSFSFTSYLRKLRDTLINVSDPIEYMCAALHLRQKNVVALDFELEKQFLKNKPQHFDLLANHDTRGMEECSIQEGDPTLLHFAARYNLIKLAVAILKCPGGYNALSICNIDGYTPSQIAMECGHDNLAYALGDAQQRHNITVEPEDIYQSMHDPIYDSYVTIVGNAQDDDVYVPMDNSDEDGIYEPMASQEDFYENSETYLIGCTADTRSIASVSSTGSSDSAGSTGSGPIDRRPPMPRPRHTQSHDEMELREKFNGFNREAKSMTERGSRQYAGHRFSSLPRGASQQVAQYPPIIDREDLPPPPPPPVRSPNFYQ